MNAPSDAVRGQTAGCRKAQKEQTRNESERFSLPPSPKQSACLILAVNLCAKFICRPALE